MEINVLKNNELLVEVFTAQESASWVKILMGLRKYWIKRDVPGFDVSLAYWTLGNATYLDGTYKEIKNLKRNNQRIIKKFAGLYEQVRQKLSEALKAEVVINDQFTIPGFHIYSADYNWPLGIEGAGQIHLDRPHRRTDYDFKYSDVLSFTLPFQLPIQGGGLTYWLQVPGEIIEVLEERGKWYHELDDAAQAWLAGNRQVLPYTIGKMAIHDCDTVHQVTNDTAMQEGDFRITMQGHGVFHDNRWLLYF